MWRHELETLRALDLVRVGTHLAEFRLTEKEYLILLEQHREMKIRLEALLLAKATSEQELGSYEQTTLIVMSELAKDVRELTLRLKNHQDNLASTTTKKKMLQQDLIMKENEAIGLKKDSQLLTGTKKLLQEQCVQKKKQLILLKDQVTSTEAKKILRQREILKIRETLTRIQVEIDVLSKHQRAVSLQIDNYQALNKKLTGDIDVLLCRQTQDSVKIQKVRGDLVWLEREIMAKHAKITDWKNSIALKKQRLDEEIHIGLTLSRKISESQHLAKVKLNVLATLKKQIETLDYDNRLTKDDNRRLSDLVKACRQHLINLQLCSQDLVGQMERSVHQDSRVRTILDSKLLRLHEVKSPFRPQSPETAKLGQSRTTNWSTSSNFRKTTA